MKKKKKKCAKCFADLPAALQATLTDMNIRSYYHMALYSWNNFYNMSGAFVTSDVMNQLSTKLEQAGLRFNMSKAEIKVARTIHKKVAVPKWMLINFGDIILKLTAKNMADDCKSQLVYNRERTYDLTGDERILIQHSTDPATRKQLWDKVLRSKQNEHECAKAYRLLVWMLPEAAAEFINVIVGENF